MCVFLYPGYLPPKKAFNRAFISTSMMQTDVLKTTLRDTVLCLQAWGRHTYDSKETSWFKTTPKHSTLSKRPW